MSGSSTDLPLIDPATFRRCMRQVPGAVTVVTTLHQGTRSGMTATAVCSVSADPPQILVCVNRSSNNEALITAAGRFGVSFLAHDQQTVADAFSSGSEDLEARFASAAWIELASGIPILEGAAAAFDCVVAQAVQAGTHTIFIGAVVAALAREGRNLIYKSGDFHAL